MKKLIFSGLLTLTMGFAYANGTTHVGIEKAVENENVSTTIMMLDGVDKVAEDDSGICRFVGWLARIGGRLFLKLDKDEAKELQKATEDLCNELI